MGAVFTVLALNCVMGLQQREEVQYCVYCVSAELCYKGCSSNMQGNVELVCRLSI